MVLSQIWDPKALGNKIVEGPAIYVTLIAETAVFQ